MKNKNLKKRILHISYKNNLSHIGSCLTAVDIIADIYEKKKPDEKFVLSAGHAHLAHAVVMQHWQKIGDILPEYNAESVIKKYGIHCERAAGCDVSTGSLGQGLPIAVGMALADRSKDVYCLISDGECAEGSIHEALRIAADKRLRNLKVYVNNNSYGAYDKTNYKDLIMGNGDYTLYDPVDVQWINTNVNEFPIWLQKQNGHYVVMNEEQYKEALEVLL